MTDNWQLKIGGVLVADYTDDVQALATGGGKNIETVNGYGAAAPVFLDHGNFAGVQRFKVVKEWADDAAAQSWYETGKASYDGVADVLVIRRKILAGGGTLVWKLSGAKIELQIEEPLLSLTITNFTFTGLPVLQP
jgi:hypothetical protein